MPIQDGSIPSSSFEWAVRALPFCLSDSIYLPREVLAAVGIPFYASASSVPLSAPDPTAALVLVDPSHRQSFHVVENCFFLLVMKCFWVVRWANSIEQWQLWKQQRQEEAECRLLEAAALPAGLKSEGMGGRLCRTAGRLPTARRGLLHVGCDYRLINNNTSSFMTCPERTGSVYFPISVFMVSGRNSSSAKAGADSGTDHMDFWCQYCLPHASVKWHGRLLGNEKHRNKQVVIMWLELRTGEQICIKKELFCLFRQHHLTLNKYLDTLYSVALLFFF